MHKGIVKAQEQTRVRMGVETTGRAPLLLTVDIK
jgi:hypothetical protein